MRKSNSLRNKEPQQRHQARLQRERAQVRYHMAGSLAKAEALGLDLSLSPLDSLDPAVQQLLDGVAQSLTNRIFPKEQS